MKKTNPRGVPEWQLGIKENQKPSSIWNLFCPILVCLSSKNYTVKGSQLRFFYWFKKQKLFQKY
jgi:hypothetical protein